MKTLTFPEVQFDNAADRYVRELLETYTAGLTVAELGRRIRYAADCRHSRDAAHRAVDDLIRAGVAEHVAVPGGGRVVRLVTAATTAPATEGN